VKVEVRDRRIHQVLDIHGTLEQVATGFLFVEGPAWHPRERHLIFSDILGDAIYRWSPKDGVSLFRQPSNMANGNTYDRQGRLLTCEHATSRVTRTEGDGRVTVIASHYGMKELNSPNDIVVMSDGAIHFTDPNSGRGAKYGVAREQELPFQGVYRLDPQNGMLTLLVEDFDKPNGLCFSSDDRRLFVSDTSRYHIRVFDLQADGTLTNGRVWAEMSREGVGVPDGMKTDRDGNLYCTGPGGIHLFDPDANYLGIIQMPEPTTNLAWGDEDLCSLYVTAATSIYRLRANVPGLATF
jgi:gluconolactonase